MIGSCHDMTTVFHKFQGDSKFLHNIPGYFQGSRSQNKFQAFQGGMGTLAVAVFCYGKCYLGTQLHVMVVSQ